VLDFSQPATISKEKLISDDYLWNILAHGNQFDYYLIKKLLTHQKLSVFMENNGLFLSQGYSAGKRDKKTDEFSEYPILDNSSKEAILPFCVNSNYIKEQESELKYERLKNTQIYRCNIKLLVNRNFKRKYKIIPTALYFGRLIFSNTVNCIASKNDGYNENIFYYLEAVLNSKLYTYFQVHMSKALNALQPEIGLDKIKNFPIVSYDVENAIIEQIVSLTKQIHETYATKNRNALGFEDNDISETKAATFRKEIDNLIYALYELSPDDCETVLYTLDFVLPQAFNAKSVLASKASVKEYCRIISDHFNEIICDDGYKILYEIKESFAYYKAIFIVVEKDVECSVDISSMPAVLELMTLFTDEEFNSSLLINKKIRGFYNNAFYIAKTKDAYNWSRFNAIVDINDFTEDVFAVEEEETSHE
jgi:hypothetical protein